MDHKDSLSTLERLRHMISEAKKLNEETIDRAKGTRMLKDIVAHETARSKKAHGAPRTDDDATSSGDRKP